MQQNFRTYDRNASAAFSKTRENFGEFQNMASGYPIMINDLVVPSSEHLYQALRFSHLPAIQEQILAEHNAFRAKQLAHENIADSRPDFQHINIRVMKFVLRAKLTHNFERMSRAYEASADMPIVEISTKSTFWGAAPKGANLLVGTNALGRLHMGMRQDLRAAPSAMLNTLPVPAIDGLRLLGTTLSDWERPARSSVLNKHHGHKECSGVIYIGRPSPYGNPIKLSEDTDRGSVLQEYLAYLHANPDFVDKARRELGAKDLICWCAPKLCHGDILADLASGKMLPLARPPMPNPPPQQSFDL